MGIKTIRALKSETFKPDDVVRFTVTYTFGKGKSQFSAKLVPLTMQETPQSAYEFERKYGDL